MPKHSVVILTAGRGTRMGKHYSFFNKAILPINKQAIISRIIHYFPKNTEFTIAVGHLQQQVKDYLAIAHGDARIRIVEVKNYDGPGSGPGLSLLSCEPYLQKPFFFVSCDSIIEWKSLNKCTRTI